MMTCFLSSVLTITYSYNIGNTLDDGENPICKVPLQVENINGNLMITILFDDDTDEDVDDDGVLVVATADSTRQCKTKQYDDNMITRRVCAKRSDNE